MSNPASRRPLVIGYGNTLRRDDGVGRVVAESLADDPRAAGIQVIATHQLAPEHAVDLHRASLAVLVDAQVVGSPPPLPGHCVVTQLAKTPPRPTPTEGGASSHHCTPEVLADLAQEIYGFAPPVFLVGVGVASIDVGDDLSREVAVAMQSIMDLVLTLALRRD